MLHRAAGGWRNVGTVPLDSADLPAALADLHGKGERLEPGGVCKLIIPNDQIRYLTIETGISDLESRRRLALAALEGATPYAVDELVFDLSEEGSRTHIAAVALETLQEAESFALDNGFTPASFVASPGEMDFLGEPFFGPAPSFPQSDVEPDGIAVVDIGPADVPTAAPAKDAPKGGDEDKADLVEKASDADKVDALPAKERPSEHDAQAPAKSAEAPETKPDNLTLPKAPALAVSPSGDADPTAATEAEDQDNAPIAGFSSRRRKSDNAAPALAGVERGSPAAPKAPAVAAPAATKGSPPSTAKAETKADTKSDGAKTPPAPVASPAKGATTQKQPGGKSGPKSAPPPAPESAAVAAPAQAARVAAESAKPSASAPTGAAAQTADGLALPEVKGKPRFLGLILTVALLLAMAAVAAFALLSDGGGFFSSERPSQEIRETNETPAEEPQEANEQDDSATDAPAAAQEALSDQLLSEAETEAESIAPQVSAIPSQPDPGVVELSDPGRDPDAPADNETLASTDQAVLDAFQEDEITEQTEQEAALSAAALYAATGIWQQVPEIAEAPALVSLNDIYVASIDNSDLSQDAVALSTMPSVEADALPETLSSPAAAGSDFDLDERGLVTATPEGTVNPDGIMIFLGRPSVVPPPTPARPDSPESAAAEAENARIAALSLLRPRPRPSDLAEQAERALLGGLTREELAKLRPRARPASLKTEAEENQPVSALAVSSSIQPRARPANFANLVDRATRSRTTAAATENAAAAATVLPPPSVTPSIPSSASVARQATVTNAINLRRLNLIGVSGKPSNRQALVRLPNGRYRKVRVGDRLDGGTVVAIGDTQLQYQKRGTNTTLKLPGS